MKKSTWNTYATTCYTHDVANDQASAGGVHHHQIRLTKNGGWQKRIEQTNGRHSVFSPVMTVTSADGEAAYARAQKY